MMRRTRRLGIALAGLVTAGLLAAGALTPAYAHGGHDDHGRTGQFDAPYEGFMKSSTTLRNSTPKALGLDPAPIDAAWRAIDGFAAPADPAVKPMYASAVGVMGHQGRVVSEHATGYALLYADATTKLPESQRIAAKQDTIYDMASVSKLFTSIVIMQLVEKGLVDLDATYGSYLPEFANGGKETITIRQMLTHTSGLVSWLPLWSDYPDKASRIKAVMDVPVKNPPGTVYEYSDLNLISLGVLAERLTGKSLDVLVAKGITGPLKMVDTGYNPDASKKPRIAATEYQVSPARGMVWGSVHDENAWSLGGVAGHAGVFSTARDMAILAQTMLNGGAYGGKRILSERSVRAMITDENTEFPGDSHGLGFELNQLWYMGGLAAGSTAGHTGYTGTSLVIDFASRSFAVLLTNRVHPSRDWGSNNPSRRAIAQGLAEAMSVSPQKGRTEWFGGTQDAAEHTLSVAVPSSRHALSLSFDVFADLEPTDVFALEASSDGGETWSLVPYTVRFGHGGHGRVVETDGTFDNQGNRDWGQAEARLPDGADALRWRYTTDANTQGRGAFVDGVMLRDGRRVVLNGEADRGAFTADGFTEVRR
ncbi:beta-lactamase family protein [Microbacterium sp. KUDC0406]|uniref:serine hydrolase domain-containing protein n=1 Tax=Microbacterium sp. KUDC0406 TaxID=2909588 RepID=UPI001F292837|nr:serine hydrolase domain-containing protein [Microbacterium sp. KUDC0406]UJP10523.1 beta-lactamase family protein [Microbacterium sp. KUDC0406]